MNESMMTVSDSKESYAYNNIKNTLSSLEEKNGLLVEILKEQLIKEGFLLEGAYDEMLKTSEFINSILHYPCLLSDRDYDDLKSENSISVTSSRLASMRAQIAIEDAKKRKMRADKNLVEAKAAYRIIRALHVALLEKEKKDRTATV